MKFTKRDFLKAGALAGMSFALAPSLSLTGAKAFAAEPGFDPLPPISVEERKTRVAKAQELMRQAGIGALIIEPGSSMLYFTAIRWWRSERLTAVVIPAEGEIGVVTPYFEEPSIRESMAFGDDVRTWNENENPLELVNGILKDRGVTGRPIAMEETVRYFVISELKKVNPSLDIINGDAITLGCRMYKSDHELALMQRAADITIAAYGAAYPQIRAGMRPGEINDILVAETARFGGVSDGFLVLVNESSAYPHGSGQPQTVTEGGVVLLDGGCDYQGYQSDISRTFVYGEPTKHQREVWDTVRRGQQMAYEAARPGVPAGHIDDIVRQYYQSLGYGPGYKTPGTPHRLGHGIGMDGHERVNLVGGEKTLLAPRMCFSNEPGIYIYGEFGIRLEDCMHITEAGARWFSTPPSSIDKPFG